MKYAVLLLALMFVGCGGGSSTGTVGYVLKDYRGTLQIANEDLSSEMNFVEAMKACEGLGNGWRLPHVWELDIMHKYLHQNAKGNFKDGFYWSNHNRSEYGGGFGFGSGRTEKFDKNTKLFVRAVRTLP
jgi:hypothetical protein